LYAIFLDSYKRHGHSIPNNTRRDEHQVNPWNSRKPAAQVHEYK